MSRTVVANPEQVALVAMRRCPFCSTPCARDDAPGLRCSSKTCAYAGRTFDVIDGQITYHDEPTPAPKRPTTKKQTS